MVANALCEIAQAHARFSTMVSASHPHITGANMLTRQNLSKITVVVLLSLLALAALSVTLSAVLGPPSLWMFAR
jgi:hypothetical protein